MQIVSNHGPPKARVTVALRPIYANSHSIRAGTVEKRVNLFGGGIEDLDTSYFLMKVPQRVKMPKTYIIKPYDVYFPVGPISALTAGHFLFHATVHN